MNICSHCGQPWENNACRIPGVPVDRDSFMAKAKSPVLMMEDSDDEKEDARNQEVLGR
jgi:hypothetical protein